MSEGSFEVRKRLKERQWKAIEADLRSAAPLRTIDLILVPREDPTSDPTVEFDVIMDSLGLKTLGDNWASVDEGEPADLILQQVIGFRLVSGEEILLPIETTATVDHLVDTFRYRPRFYTNVLAFDQGGLTGWTPVSTGDFDAVIGIIDQDFVGLISIVEMLDRPN